MHAPRDTASCQKQMPVIGYRTAGKDIPGHVIDIGFVRADGVHGIANIEFAGIFESDGESSKRHRPTP
jgi:hypothetical protein